MTTALRLPDPFTPDTTTASAATPTCSCCCRCCAVSAVGGAIALHGVVVAAAGLSVHRYYAWRAA
ncbi:hypothetical protein ACIGNX_20750 [Actinosynnema sp. NPDC053489]|uniref:hypothetical protein n=1 Tax=Actinosynnema sp. NPDC053489 TaxID=3363916 RepID=UPI0037C72914